MISEVAIGVAYGLVLGIPLSTALHWLSSHRATAPQAYSTFRHAAPRRR